MGADTVGGYRAPEERAARREEAARPVDVAAVKLNQPPPCSTPPSPPPTRCFQTNGRRSQTARRVLPTAAGCSGAACPCDAWETCPRRTRRPPPHPAGGKTHEINKRRLDQEFNTTHKRTAVRLPRGTTDRSSRCSVRDIQTSQHASDGKLLWKVEIVFCSAALRRLAAPPKRDGR